jgi:hypothetical protein
MTSTLLWFALDVEQASGPKHVIVTLAGFDEARVRIEELPDATARQRRLRAQWLSGN